MFEGLKNYFASWTRQESVELYCDNPQCQKPITGSGQVGYSIQNDEVYHNGFCAMFAETHRIARDPQPIATVGNIEYISMRRAKSLFLRRKLKQARGERPVSAFASP